MPRSIVSTAAIVSFAFYFSVAASSIEKISDPDVLLENGNFVSRGTDSIQVHAWYGSLAAAGIDSILARRSHALTTLCDLLDTQPPQMVNLFFYPDETTKFKQTKHRGIGWGQGTTIVEVLNDSIQVDPYHELAHVVLYQIGVPPCMWDEGFAVYASETLGSDAARHMGYPDETINKSLERHLAGREPYSWKKLTSFGKMGDAEDVVLAYLQSASIVSYIAAKYGEGSLRNILYAVATSTRDDGLSASNEALQQVLGESGNSIWEGWRKWMNL